jgi:hypothetical protein
LLSSFISTAVEGVLSGLRSQNNPRRTVPDGVPPGAANLGFSAFFLSKAVRPPLPPRRLDRPVLGSSASGFPTTAQSSALVCLTGKSVNSSVESELGWQRKMTRTPTHAFTMHPGGFINHRERTVLTVKIHQPSHEFTFGVGTTFVSYPLVLTPVV